MTTSLSVTQFGQVAPKKVLDSTTLQSPKLTGLGYPIETSPTNGYFSKSNLKTLIRTERGERFMRPDYGCNLRKFLMEPLDDTTFSLIKEEVVTSIRRYLRTVSMNKIQVFETRGGQLRVNLFCAVRNARASAFDVGVRI